MEYEHTQMSQVRPDIDNDEVQESCSENEQDIHIKESVGGTGAFVGAQFICDEDYESDNSISDDSNKVELVTNTPIAGKRPRIQSIYRQNEQDEIFDLTCIFQQSGIEIERAISICRAWIALMTAITGTKKRRTKKTTTK